MTAAAPIYDLTLLLDLSATDDVRAKIVEDTRGSIEGGGTLLSHQPWGVRQLAYPVKRREAAEYHLFQFNGGVELLESLEHNLSITDGVLRHRVVKLPPGAQSGTPDAAPVVSEPAAAEAPAAPAPEGEPAAPLA